MVKILVSTNLIILESNRYFMKSFSLCVEKHGGNNLVWNNEDNFTYYILDIFLFRLFCKLSVSIIVVSIFGVEIGQILFIVNKVIIVSVRTSGKQSWFRYCVRMFILKPLETLSRNTFICCIWRYIIFFLNPFGPFINFLIDKSWCLLFLGCSKKIIGIHLFF